jgi:hypothetical protein
MVVAPQVADDMRRLLLLLLLTICAAPSRAEFHGVIIEGLPGNQEYAEQFRAQTEALQAAVQGMGGKGRVHLLREGQAGKADVQKLFEGLTQRLKPGDRIAIYLVGHGSYDGFEYKFNIPGPDLNGADIAALVNGLPSRKLVLAIPGSASGALLELLKDDGRRIVITGTRSGSERNATRFGGFFAAALAEPAADVNKDEAISVKEAFEYAERRVADYYETEGSLATEHPQIAGDDLAAYLLARLGGERTEDDPRIAGLLQQREALDGKILQLQLNREALGEEDYFARLQDLMIDLAEIDGEIERLRKDIPDAP